MPPSNYNVSTPFVHPSGSLQGKRMHSCGSRRAGGGEQQVDRRTVGEENKINNKEISMKTIKKPIAGYYNFKNLLMLARNPNKILI